MSFTVTATVTDETTQAQASAAASALVTPLSMGDGTYAGWQTWTAPAPDVWMYGSAWTAAQIAALKAAWPSTRVLTLDTVGNVYGVAGIDVESKYVTSSQTIANWIQQHLAQEASPGLVYLNASGSYTLGGANDIFLGAGINAGYGLMSHFNLYAGEHYKLWVARTTGSQPSAPGTTAVGPGGAAVEDAATQFASYAETGHSFDLGVMWDSDVYEGLAA